MYQYTQEEFKSLRLLREELIQKHKKCKGFGYTKNGDCSCLKIFRYIKRLIFSNIPREYWALTLKDLHVKNTIKRLIIKYLKNFSTAQTRGLGYLFLGNIKYLDAR